MKVIIAGSRSIRSRDVVSDAIEESEFDITEVVSGGAIGVDLLGELWAERSSIKAKVFFPDWKGLGKRAGIERNKKMAGYADALIAVWDGKSKGTKNMIEEARRRGLKIFVKTV